MPSPLIEASKTDIELRPAPIEASWIAKGTPTARNATLSHSSDGTAWTMIWECSEGEFNWHYDFDETLYFLQGQVLIESDTMRRTSFGPGDMLFFKKGAHAYWRVVSPVRKIAFCRQPQPQLVSIASKAVSRLNRAGAGLVQLCRASFAIKHQPRPVDAGIVHPDLGMPTLSRASQILENRRYGDNGL